MKIGGWEWEWGKGSNGQISVGSDFLKCTTPILDAVKVRSKPVAVTSR